MFLLRSYIGYHQIIQLVFSSGVAVSVDKLLLCFFTLCYLELY